MNHTLFFSTLFHASVLKAILLLQLICPALGFTVYGFIRLIFSDHHFSLAEDLDLIMQSLLAGWVLGLCIGLLMVVVEMMDFVRQKSMQPAQAQAAWRRLMRSVIWTACNRRELLAVLPGPNDDARID